MGKSWKLFLRVLRSYSIEEKVISIILCGGVIFLGTQMVLDNFSAPAVSGQSYNEGLISDRPTILNPLFVDFSEANRDLSALVFSGLSKYDPIKKAFVDDMAELKISQDRKTYKYTMKNNLRWQDGEKLTADDVYFTFHDLIQNPDFQNPVLKVNFEGVQIQETDPNTIEFRLKTPNAFFITNMNVGIVPKHIISKYTIADLPTIPFNLKPIGSGPYKVENAMEVFDDGRQRVTLTAFDHYYGQMPTLQSIHFTIYPDEESLTKEKKGLDMVARVPTGSLADFKNDDHFQFSTYALPQYTAIFLNTDSPILKKEKVRVALLKGLDKTELLKSLANKIAVDTPLLELNQSDWIYKPNLKEAKGALYDSGYKIDSSKKEPYRYDSKGNVLQLVLLARAYDQNSSMLKEVKTVTTFLTKAWGELGIKLIVQFAQTDDFNKRLQARDYDMILTGQSLGYNLDTYSYWHSSQAKTDGLNLSNYKSFAADKIIELIRDSFDQQQKEQSLKDLARTLSEDVPAIFLYRPAFTFASDNKVKGVNTENMAFPSDRFAHIETWCVECTTNVPPAQ